MKYINADRLREELNKWRDVQPSTSGLPRKSTYEAMGVIQTIDYVLSLIDSLPEQPVEGLEEAAKEYANREYPNEPSCGQWGTGDYEPPVDMEYPREIAKDSFKAGAEWMAGQGWISVDEKLPDMDEEVIVLTDELGTAPIYKIAFGHIVDVERCIDYNGWNIPGVKYWMPCPEIPNNDSNKKNMRIPFDISKRPQIESGEYKVVYVENSSSEQCPVEILKWDSNSDAGCIIGCVRRKGKDRIYAFQENGVHTVSDEDDRLFLVTPEPEMSDFEKAVSKYRPQSDTLETIQRIAAELLSLAKQQLLQSGELLTQEHHEKLVESLNNAHEEELEKAYKNSDEVQYRKGYEKGKEDALNNLPRWRKCPENDYYACVYNCAKREDSLLYYNGHTLRLIDLEKLPGFKGEDHE